MKRNKAMALRVATVFVALAAVVFLFWFPQVEGRNVNATQFEIYFKDPFLAFAYVAAIPFFTILYQAFRALSRTAAEDVAKRARAGKRCAIACIGFVWVGLAWLLTMESDDRPPLFMMAAIVTIIFAGVALVARRFEIRFNGGNEGRKKPQDL